MLAPGTQAVVERVEELAKKKGISMARLSLAWMLTKDAVSAPIIGSTKIEKLEDAVGKSCFLLPPRRLSQG